MVNVAVVGCAHGELSQIYASIDQAAEFHGITVDLALFTGDFQAIRNEDELCMMACPPKYAQMGSFHEFYEKIQKPPSYPSIFIGGNHESIQHSWQAYHGAYVSPNIYYLGFSGVVRFGPLLISGISGIYKAYDAQQGYYEKLPGPGVKSLYHTRDYEIWKMARYHELLGLKGGSHQSTIMLSHDWPAGIEGFGDKEFLLRVKPHFESDIEGGRLGSPSHRYLLDLIQPDYWFSSHLHVRYSALYPHTHTHAKPNPNPNPTKETKFLALDKCAKHRNFLHILQIPDQDSDVLQITRDPLWVRVCQEADSLFPLGLWDKSGSGSGGGRKSVSHFNGQISQSSLHHDLDKDFGLYYEEKPDLSVLEQTRAFCDWAGLEFRYDKDPATLLTSTSTSSS